MSIQYCILHYDKHNGSTTHEKSPLDFYISAYNFITNCNTSENFCLAAKIHEKKLVSDDYITADFIYQNKIVFFLNLMLFINYKISWIKKHFIYCCGANKIIHIKFCLYIMI